MVYSTSAGCFLGAWRRDYWHNQSRQLTPAINRKHPSASRKSYYNNVECPRSAALLCVPRAPRAVTPAYIFSSLKPMSKFGFSKTW